LTTAIKDLFAQAEALLRQRDIDAAEKLLSDILSEDPKEPNSLRLLGVIRLGQGRPEEAISLLADAVNAAPDFHRANLDYARALFEGQQSQQASHILEPLCPVLHNAEAWQLLGNVRIELGDPEQGRAAFRKAAEVDPLRTRIAQGVRSLSQGRGRDAEAAFRGVLKENPDHVHALIGLATIAMDAGAVGDATRLLKHGQRISPHTDALWRGLARAHSERADYAAAKHAAERAVALAPGVADCWTMLGTVLASALDPEAARDAFRKSLELKTDQPRVMLSLGHVEKTLGNPQASEAAYSRALSHNPLLGEAMWSKADLKTYRFGDDEIQAMLAALKHKDTTEQDRAAFHFALGKAYEDRQAFQASFEHYGQGNAIKAKHEQFPLDDFNTRGADIRRATEQMQPPAKPTGAVTVPIFILGMPRAGSTLLEQILASHSAVEGTMELPHILNYSREIDAGPHGYPGALTVQSDDHWHALGHRYLEETRAFRGNKPFFIDKMPNNFPHIGLVAKMLPQAVFVDARRDPMDCCFSVFKQNFARGQTFSYDLDVLAGYYKSYITMIEHWQRVLPQRVLSVRYEDVVADLEGQVRRLLSHCGLEFEAACITFHQTKRAVRTASAQQVRQPIYASGVGHWRHYEPWLEPLKTALAGLKA
jgi:predicted Zn-dependent protease|tara:strand:- start:8538 stop:10490 length:1953 start_codon:yes stop_codon:yes gene_type:complete